MKKLHNIIAVIIINNENQWNTNESFKRVPQWSNYRLSFSCSFFPVGVSTTVRIPPPRKAMSRAIPVITTTSIFVKSLSPVWFFAPLSATDFRKVLSISRFINLIAAPHQWKCKDPCTPCDIFQIINFYDGVFSTVFSRLPRHSATLSKHQSGWICPISCAASKWLDNTLRFGSILLKFILMFMTNIIPQAWFSFFAYMYMLLSVEI